MKKIVRLTESDLTRLVKRIIKESKEEGDIEHHQEMGRKFVEYKQGEAPGGEFRTLGGIELKYYNDPYGRGTYEIYFPTNQETINFDIDFEKAKKRLNLAKKLEKSGTSPEEIYDILQSRS